MSYKYSLKDTGKIYGRAPFLFAVATITAAALLLLLWRMPASCGMNLDKTKLYFLKGDYKQAIKEGERTLAQAGKDSRGLNELYYILGVSYMKDGNLLRASDIFEIILHESRSLEFRDEADIGLADTYFLRGDYDTAEKHYKEMVERKSYARFADGIYYRLKRCAEKRGDSAAAADYAARISRNFPPPGEENGLDVLRNPGFYYTVQAGSFSRQANADGLKEELAKKGYDAYVEKYQRPGGGNVLYRVKVGKFGDRGQAEDSAKKLAKEGYPIRICP